MEPSEAGYFGKTFSPRLQVGTFAPYSIKLHHISMEGVAHSFP